MRVHVVPMEMPNRRFPSPPPFMFHPELQPELAERNPKNFTPMVIPPHRKNPKFKASKQGAGATLVLAGAEKRF